MPERERYSLTRRGFLRAAVVAGGTAGLLAALSYEESDIPVGSTRARSLPDRQHAWNEYSDTDKYGNVLLPRHHVILFLNYPGNGTPSNSEREHVEAAFQTLEDAFEWGNRGLLFSVSYSRDYFDRFESPLPDSVDLPHFSPFAETDNTEYDKQDMVVRLSSDRASAVLSAEQALRGEVDTVNGVPIRAVLTDVVSVDDRRTGFVGSGLPAKHTDNREVPGDAITDNMPLFTGFKSGFKKNQATEDAVTITDGPFAGGTVQNISKMQISLSAWYERESFDRRVALMFSPTHAEQHLVEGTGENLGTGPDVLELGVVDDVEEIAQEKGVVGHTQKLARARDDDGNPRILRRDFNTVDGGKPGLHFVSLQQGHTDFKDAAFAMHGGNLAGKGDVGQAVNNGILNYVFMSRRGHFLMPPRSQRAFPTPQGN